MTDWLPGFDYALFSQSLGFPYRSPVRAVAWHCTQGWRAEHAFNVYRRAPKGSCPHFTVEYAGTNGRDTVRDISKRRFQHVPMSWASYAVQRGNDDFPCHVETNASGIIQIERVGFADDDVTVDEMRWLGEEILAPILQAYPEIPPSVYKGPRMTEAEWQAWPGGQCGHRDVPCQPDGHTDPGDLDLDVILHYALELLDNDSPKDEVMPDYILRNGQDLTDPWLAVYPTGTLRHVGGTEAGCLIDGKYPDGRQFLDGKTLPLVDEFDVDAYNRARVLAGA